MTDKTWLKFTYDQNHKVPNIYEQLIYRICSMGTLGFSFQGIQMSKCDFHKLNDEVYEVSGLFVNNQMTKDEPTFYGLPIEIV